MYSWTLICPATHASVRCPYPYPYPREKLGVVPHSCFHCCSYPTPVRPCLKQPCILSPPPCPGCNAAACPTPEPVRGKNHPSTRPSLLLPRPRRVTRTARCPVLHASQSHALTYTSVGCEPPVHTAQPPAAASPKRSPVLHAPQQHALDHVTRARLAAAALVHGDRQRSAARDARVFQPAPLKRACERHVPPQKLLLTWVERWWCEGGADGVCVRSMRRSCKAGWLAGWLDGWMEGGALTQANDLTFLA
eukprot:366567-Chlamydomonas_euryale.AAC.2